jgi:hypothetical protein
MPEHLKLRMRLARYLLDPEVLLTSATRGAVRDEDGEYIDDFVRFSIEIDVPRGRI